jgi:ribokinase
MKFVDFLTPNETEISELLKSSRKNVNSIDEAFEILKKFGLKNLIVKMGEKGVIFKSDHEKFTINALRVKVKDTTAAGDVFNGSFAVALQKNMNLKKALEFANAAAAISVTRKGAQPSIPTYEEVEKFLKSQN